MGQAFWVHANAATPNLTITEAAKTSAGGGKFYREAPSRSQFLKITISKEDWIDNAYFKLNSDATEDYDAFDGFKLKNPFMNVFLVDKTQRHLAMHTLDQIPGYETPIGVEISEAGTYTLSVTNDENFATEKELFFVDKYQGTILSIRDAKGYAFKTTQTGVIVDRFYLTSNPGTTFEKISVVVYPNPATTSVRVNASHGILQLQTRDINGNVIATLEKGGEYIADVDLSSLSAGVYILAVKTKAGIHYQRIVKR
jgi:hypothetical protein